MSTRVIHALCTSDTSDVHTDVLLQWIGGVASDPRATPNDDDQPLHPLLLLRSCARALVERIVDAGIEGERLRSVVSAICVAIRSTVSTSSPLAKASQQVGNDSVDVPDVVSSLFGYLRSLRVRLSTASRNEDSAELLNVGENIMQPLGFAIRAYVTSQHLSPQGYVKAVQLFPAAALENLLGLYTGGEDCENRSAAEIRKACLLASVDGQEAFGGVLRHAPDVLTGTDEKTSVLSTSPLELALAEYAYEDVPDCHRMLQQLSVCVELDERQRGLVGGAIERLTRRVLVRKNKEDVPVAMPDAVENFEEGELLVSVYKSDADVRRKAKGVKRDVEGLVPRRVGCGMVVRGLLLGEGGSSGTGPEAGEVGEEVVRRQCDAFAAVKRVTREVGQGGDTKGSYVVEMTSMPGAVRCYEAMRTRELRFWGEIGGRLVAVPEVEIIGVDHGAGYGWLFLEGVESIEQEDRVKEMLQEKGLPKPSGWVPVGAGVKGVVLCFRDEEDGRRVFTELGGVIESDETSEKRRKRDGGVTDGRQLAGDVEGAPGAKRARTIPMPPEASQRIYKVLRNRQYQGSFHLAALDGAGPLDADWPETLDASQRVDINYLYNSLFPSRPKLRVGALWPIEDQDRDGMRKLDGYLRGKGRAGVVVLGRRTLYLIPSTAEACAYLRVDEFYGDHPLNAMLCVMMDEA